MWKHPAGVLPAKEEIVKGTTVMNNAATTLPPGPYKDIVIQAFLGRTDASSELRPTQQEIECRVRTGRSNPNTEILIRSLNEALGTTIICILRYKRHYFTTTKIRSRRVETMLLQHVTDEQASADQLAERIVQLGGKAILPLERLMKQSHAEQDEGDSLAEKLRADLLAERSATHNYRTLIASIDTDDSRTRQVLEQILAQEEMHVENLSKLVRD